MQRIEIVMTEEEKLTLQFRLFEYNGIQVTVDQFVHSNNEYSTEHSDRIIKVLLEKYSALQLCLFGILEAHGHKRIPMKNYDFSLNDNSLTVHI